MADRKTPPPKLSPDDEKKRREQMQRQMRFSIGYLLSVLIRSQVGASQIALLVTMLPTTLLSGYIFPIDQMPKLVQAITYLIYSRYYVSIVKDLFLKGSSLAELSTPILFLVIYAVAVMILAARAFRKQLD